MVIDDERNPVLGTFLLAEIGSGPCKHLVVLARTAQITQGRASRTVSVRALPEPFITATRQGRTSRWYAGPPAPAPGSRRSRP